ncbi:MAG: hypothetical protein LBH31_05850 [Burkholderiaceae bacterium]|nr:hypothetical protein [Burkholderiaceae bacterium]
MLVSRSVYDPSFTVTGPLPNNGNPTGSGTAAAAINAVSPGTFPNVFTNDANDANFGVTSDIWLDQWTPGATNASQNTNLTAMAKQAGFDISTSFPSKSELALNVSQDRSAITFVGYNAPSDQIDISNSNTPGVIDPTNTDVATPAYRTVAQLNLASNTLSFTPTNAYAGNNGRAAVLAGGMYYLVGNAGNSGKNPKPTTGQIDMLTMNTGVQSIAPGASCPFSQVIGQFISGSGSGNYTVAPPGTPCSLASMGTISGGSATDDQFGFSIAALSTPSVPVAADKTGKDDNFRGLFVDPNGTMFTSKGSGSNGVNTVYQVGATGALANGGKLPQNAPISVAPGFPTTLAANLPSSLSSPWTLSTGVGYPFGMWVPAGNTSLMFVGDEGDLIDIADASIGSGGLWVYQQAGGSGGAWTPIAHITQGLNLGVAYTVTDTAGTYGARGASYTTTPDGLRNITGQVNSDGSYTIYAVTSTIGNSLGTDFDEGADSNQLVKITLTVKDSAVTTSGFTVMQTAPYGQVLRGVALVP